MRRIQRLILMWSVKRCEIVGKREDLVTGLWSGGRGAQWSRWPGQVPSCCRRWQLVNSGLNEARTQDPWLYTAAYYVLSIDQCSGAHLVLPNTLKYYPSSWIFLNLCALKWPLYLMLPCLLLNMTATDCFSCFNGYISIYLLNRHV